MKKKSFMLKAVATVTLSTVLFFPAASTFAAAPDASKVTNYLPTDISSHWAKDTINNLIQAGIVNGYKEDGRTVTAQPANPITRAEFVKILVQALNLKEAPNQAKTFTDVNGQWFAESVRIASSLNLVNGRTESEFAPDAQITRGEIAAIVVRAFDKTIDFNQGTAQNFSDVEGYWGKNEIVKTSRAGIITGKEGGLAAPESNATRVEAMLMLERALKAEKNDLPKAEELGKLVIDFDKAAYQALADATAKADGNGLQLEQSSAINAEYTTNFMLDYSEYNLQILNDLSERGVTMDIAHSGEWSAETVWISNRFAAIRLHGGTYQMTVSYQGNSNVQTINTEGILYLKKMADGSWKVYGGQGGVLAAPAASN